MRPKFVGRTCNKIKEEGGENSSYVEFQRINGSKGRGEECEGGGDPSVGDMSDTSSRREKGK